MIRKRLIFLFIIQVAIVLLISGFYLDYHLGNVLENELGRRLEAIAATISSQVDAAIISFFASGDESTRTYQVMVKRMNEICSKTEMERITIFSPEGQILLDTGELPISSTYARYNFDIVEIHQALKGGLASSVLFAGNNDQLFKSGYAPIVANGQVTAVVSVEGNARSLAMIRQMQKSLLKIGLIALFFSLALAFFTSQGIVLPLQKLRKSAQGIGSGNLHEPIKVKGKGEIGFLAGTMEEMRKGIIKRDEQQQTMLAGIAHEIRNPLGGIELFAGLLQEELHEDASRRKAEKILKEARNLKQLVNEFIDFARPAPANPKVLKLEESLKEVAELLENEMKQKEARLLITGKAKIFADEQQVKQILLNLILNSLQSMSLNRKNIINAEIAPDEKFARLDISDTGGGIPHEEIDKIFEPFFSRKATGLGLGLPIVKSLLERNHGQIALTKTGADGTSFCLLFPVPEDKN